ncbi:unnamed protein product [Coffea canephora]|uniref:Root meristem growth factor 9 n=1 Tax=Coffea canephora TaxID=49390 RepID=A0A068UYZ0_COFCA|nr:unnamed protein product [Coffea canephora]
MAVAPKKHTLLMASFLLCFLLVTAQARSTPRESRGVEKADDKMLSTTKEVPTSEELEMMDYSPARKKTPIHN